MIKRPIAFGFRRRQRNDVLETNLNEGIGEFDSKRMYAINANFKVTNVKQQLR